MKTLVIFWEKVLSFISLLAVFFDGKHKHVLTKKLMIRQLRFGITQLDNGQRYSKFDEKDDRAQKGDDSWEKGYTGTSYDDLTTITTKKGGKNSLIVRTDPLSVRWRNASSEAYKKAFGANHINRLAVEGTAYEFIKEAYQVITSLSAQLQLEGTSEKETPLMDRIPTLPPFARKHWEATFDAFESSFNKMGTTVISNSTIYLRTVHEVSKNVKRDVFDEL